MIRIRFFHNPFPEPVDINPDSVNPNPDGSDLNPDPVHLNPYPVNLILDPLNLILDPVYEEPDPQACLPGSAAASWIRSMRSRIRKPASRAPLLHYHEIKCTDSREI